MVAQCMQMVNECVLMTSSYNQRPKREWALRDFKVESEEDEAVKKFLDTAYLGASRFSIPSLDQRPER